MKKHILNLFLVATIAFGAVSCKNNQEAKEETLVLDEINAAVESKDFVIDSHSSTIKWEGYKPGDSHDGIISFKEGTLSLKDNQMVAGHFILDMASIEVNDLEGEDKVQLENHLMGNIEGAEDHFFDAKKFPVAEFIVTGTSRKDGQNFLIGDLTLKDRTNEVSFPIHLDIVDSDIAVIKTEPFKIDRSKWNIQFKSKSFFENLGDNFISDDIQLEIELVAKAQ